MRMLHEVLQYEECANVRLILNDIRPRCKFTTILSWYSLEANEQIPLAIVTRSVSEGMD
jgi:hypothetical protein